MIVMISVECPGFERLIATLLPHTSLISMVVAVDTLHCARQLFSLSKKLKSVSVMF